MTRPRAVDCHTHILGEEAMRRLAGESAKVTPVMDKRGDPACKLAIDGAVVQDPFPRELWDSERRLADMDQNGVDVQVLAPTVFTFFHQHEAALGLACAALQNEEIAAEIKRHPTRFMGLAGVPLQAPELAARELTRAMQELGLRGAMIGSNVSGRNLDDPALEPFWAAAAALGAFIFVHPHAGAAAERLGAYYLKNLVGLPFETTVAGASLVFGGVLERHPDLKVCLAHGGGFLPYQAGRLRHGFALRPEAKVNLRRPPEESIGRLFYDTILHSGPALEFLIASAGADHVLLGSDYPFDMGNLDCAARVKALAIPPADRDLILGGYAGRLLGAAG
ncbi:MAG TPA: amidohydrolase family protein [Xanthobacteraceae bacterium]|nr:amidohydrolase family protein [Xanthobacteraceae bacterium]